MPILHKGFIWANTLRNMFFYYRKGFLLKAFYTLLHRVGALGQEVLICIDEFNCRSIFGKDFAK